VGKKAIINNIQVIVVEISKINQTKIHLLVRSIQIIIITFSPCRWWWTPKYFSQTSIKSTIPNFRSKCQW